MSTSGPSVEEQTPLPEEILALRRSIDNLDGAIVYLLAERFRLTTRVGIIKAREGLPAADPGREAWQTERLTRIAQEAGLDVAFAEAFRSFVTAEVIRHHHHYAGGSTTSDAA
jgi:chorismate mutase